MIGREAPQQNFFQTPKPEDRCRSAIDRTILLWQPEESETADLLCHPTDCDPGQL